MKDGFVRVAVGTPGIRVADCPSTQRASLELMPAPDERKARKAARPSRKLCVDGLYCERDLFLQRTAPGRRALRRFPSIREASGIWTCSHVWACPVPWLAAVQLRRCLSGRHIFLGVVPKRNPPNTRLLRAAPLLSRPAGRSRNRAPGRGGSLRGDMVLFLHQRAGHSPWCCEICEDLWVRIPQRAHALARSGRSSATSPPATNPWARRTTAHAGE
jgi:NAD+ synthase (glutamine-hydrolysing)